MTENWGRWVETLANLAGTPLETLNILFSGENPESSIEKSFF